jgi:surface antigen-like variable number repeat protein
VIDPRRPPSRPRRSRSSAAFLVFLALLAGRAAAQEPSPSGDEAAVRPAVAADPGTGAAEMAAAIATAGPGATIGEIRVVTKNIFDPGEPGEDRRLFRWADHLHRTTRPEVVQRQLLFKSGDPFSPAVLAESERLLRANPYLFDAQIRPVRYQDGRVDLEVVTHDVWTLRAGVSLNRAGGKNSTNFALQDSNFLGTGKDLTLWRIDTVDRISTLLRYRDPALFQTRGQLEVSYADYSDGNSQRFELERPFYSLDARWEAALRLRRFDRIDSLYTAGQIFAAFRHGMERLEVEGGTSPGLAGGATHRWRLGFTFERDHFDYAPGGDSTPAPPDRRNLAYPWIGFEYVEDGFVTEHQLDQIQRAEDLNLGRQFHARFGWSSPSLGADHGRLIGEAATTLGWRPGAGQLLLASAEGASRWWRNGAENLLVSGRLRYYAREFGRHLFYAALEGDVAHALDPENQLLLGGDSGLRGYPLRFQDGDRRVLLTLEQRFFSAREYFHLLHAGAAVFFDAGSAWFAGSDRQLLRDVGIGLRVGSNRSAQGTMVHLDLAFPLDRDRSIQSVQWLVSTSESF